MGIQIQRVQDRQLILGGLGAVQIRHAGRLGAAADWWDPNGEGLCIWAAYQPKGAANFAASLVDLSGNGNNAGDPGGAATPGWNAVNGWTFDGLAQYLTTTFVPQIDQSQSVSVYFANASVTVNNYVCGVYNGNPNTFFGLMPCLLGSGATYLNGNYQSPKPFLSGGIMAVAGNQGYRNGIANGEAIGAWGGASTHSLWIGCRNNCGVADLFTVASIPALAIYDCTLTAPQVLAVATAMAAL